MKLELLSENDDDGTNRRHSKVGATSHSNLREKHMKSFAGKHFTIL